MAPVAQTAADAVTPAVDAAEPVLTAASEIIELVEATVDGAVAASLAQTVGVVSHRAGPALAPLGSIADDVDGLVTAGLGADGGSPGGESPFAVSWTGVDGDGTPAGGQAPAAAAIVPSALVPGNPAEAWSPTPAAALLAAGGDGGPKPCTKGENRCGGGSESGTDIHQGGSSASADGGTNVPVIEQENENKGDVTATGGDGSGSGHPCTGSKSKGAGKAKGCDGKPGGGGDADADVDQENEVEDVTQNANGGWALNILNPNVALMAPGLHPKPPVSMG